MKYQPLPKELRAEVTKITPNARRIAAVELVADLLKSNQSLNGHDKLLTAHGLKTEEDNVLNLLKAYDKERNLPYHNVEHTHSVLSRLRVLLSKTQLPPGEVQLLEIAALYHDIEHGAQPRQSTNGRLSNEERSAIRADRYAKSAGFSLRQRVTLYGLIIGTTFFDPLIQPKTHLEKLLVIADLGGFCESSMEWIRQSLHVTQEKPQDQRAASLEDWYYEQLRFLDYVENHLIPEANQLRWGIKLENKKALINNLIEDKPPPRKFHNIINKLQRLLINPV